MNIKRHLLGLSLCFGAAAAHSEILDIEIQNLTQGMYFTPLLVAAHDSDIYLFRVGEEASDPLATVAEGGDISALSAVATGAGAVVSENPAEGLLAPTATASIDNLDTGELGYLSLAAMILPTNDGFVGLDSWPIPSESGTYTLYLNAYDAGSEGNDEIINGGGALGMPGIPGNPGGNGGTGATGVTSTDTNTNVHIHRGNLGDTDTAGGVSDVDSRIHRWLNPVAKVVVTVE
jgi:hypothetical protein